MSDELGMYTAFEAMVNGNANAPRVVVRLLQVTRSDGFGLKGFDGNFRWDIAIF